MTVEALKVKRDDQVELKDGLIGRVLNVSKGQSWNTEQGKLEGVLVLDVSSACGIEEVTNEDVVAVC